MADLISLPLPPELLRRLRAFCRRTGEPQGAFLRRVLDQELDRLERAAEKKSTTPE